MFWGQRRRGRSGGQALVEFALIVPLLLIFLLAVADLARLYTSLITVESAAREAADYGAFNSSNWSGSPTDPTSNYAKTLAGMTERACLAARNLPDYDEDISGTCTNPAPTYSLEVPPSVSDCSDKNNTTPCLVSVTLNYDFHLIVPIRIELFGVGLGLPSSISFSRDSTFAISDFKLDEQ